MTHFKHVPAKRCVPGAVGGNPLSPFRPARSLDSPQTLRCHHDYRVRPSILVGNDKQARVLGAECGKGLRVAADANRNGGVRLQCPDNRAGLPTTDWPEDYEVVSAGILRVPQLAADEGQRGNLTFRLPAGGQGTCEVRFIGNDQDARRSHLTDVLFRLGPTALTPRGS